MWPWSFVSSNYIVRVHSATTGLEQHIAMFSIHRSEKSIAVCIFPIAPRSLSERWHNCLDSCPTPHIAALGARTGKKAGGVLDYAMTVEVSCRQHQAVSIVAIVRKITTL